MPNPFDLREFIQRLEEKGQLLRIQGANLEDEVGALTELNGQRQGPVLLFEKFEGYPEGFRVVSGSMLNAVSFGTAIGIDAEKDNLSTLRKVCKIMQEVATTARDYPMEYVESGPIFENVHTGDDVDLGIFPVPKWHPEDGGHYIGTADLNIYQDPDTGWVNVGTYRAMIHDKNTATTYIAPTHHGNIVLKKYWSKGEPCPVVLVVGCHPLLFAMAATDAPEGVNEYEWAGAVVKQSVPVVRGPITGLPIPAYAEIALEGYVYPDDLVPEGPFGEFTGYYAGGRNQHTCIRIKAIYHRNNPIILASPPGKPPHDYSYFGSMLRSANLTNAITQAGIPGVRGAWIHEAGGSRCFIVTSITQKFYGHATHAAAIASSCQQGSMMTKYSVVVDDDIDPTNLNEVIWAMSTRSDPAEDIDVLRQCMTNIVEPTLRPADKSSGKIYKGRAIIRAVKPFDMIKNGTFSAVAENPKELLDRVKKKFPAVFE